MRTTRTFVQALSMMTFSLWMAFGSQPAGAQSDLDYVYGPRWTLPFEKPAPEPEPEEPEPGLDFEDFQLPPDLPVERPNPEATEPDLYDPALYGPGEYVEPDPALAGHPADTLETDPTVRIYRFGERATVRCAPKLACSIDLEPGEVIRGRAIGDPDRWDYSELVSGPEGAEQAHLVVRPTDYGIHTNLIVTTNRRAYRIQLVSEPYPEKPEAEQVAFTEQVAFRYPERWVEKRPAPPKPPEPAAKPASKSEGASATTDSDLPIFGPADLEKLSFDYKVIQPRRKRHRFDWQPIAIFDDGHRTFIHLPSHRVMDLAPILTGLQPGGEPYPLNATLHGQIFVVPRLFKSAELFLGVGKHRKWVRIERLR